MNATAGPRTADRTGAGSDTGAEPDLAADLAAQLERYLSLAGAVQSMLPAVRAVADLIIARLKGGGTVYSVGNGGSAADAQHFTGELIGHYRRDRRPLRAVTIGTDSATASCIANDYAFEAVFSRQIEALAGVDDVVVAFSTSGASKNIVDALAVARSNGAATVLFGGGAGGSAVMHADLALLVPDESTARIQEVHTVFLHLISEQIDFWAARA